jgi:hypothetical protein
MRDFKDTPLFAPFRIWTPSKFAKFSWPAIIGWYLVTAAAISFEPDPSGMGLKFHWSYLLQAHGFGLLIRLLAPLALLPLKPAAGLHALLKISLGACLVWLWTSPLAWLWPTPAGGIAVTLLREAGWLGILLLGARVARPSRPGVRSVVLILLGLVGIVFSVLVQSLPDLISARGIQMDNVRSGRIVSGTPPLPPGPVLRARWTLVGPASLLQPDRLTLGDRQTIVPGSADALVVEVGPGSVPPPQDTSGTRTSSPSQGTLLDDLLRDIPSNLPDSARILLLHQRVHSSIRYDRTYFPGSADDILKRRTGDCKAFALLMTEGARRLGLRAKTVHGLLASPDGYYAHAWTSVEHDGRWHDWDPTSSIPFPDARYLRFSIPERATGAFDGELAIFTLRSIAFEALETSP